MCVYAPQLKRELSEPGRDRRALVKKTSELFGSTARRSPLGTLDKRCSLRIFDLEESKNGTKHQNFATIRPTPQDHFLRGSHESIELCIALRKRGCAWRLVRPPGC